MTDMVEILREQGRHDIADEIERLRTRIAELEAPRAVDPYPGSQSAINTYVAPEYVSIPKAQLDELRARIAELEAEQALRRGTLSQTQEQRQEFGIIDNVPPNTPR